MKRLILFISACVILTILHFVIPAPTLIAANLTQTLTLEAPMPDVWGFSLQANSPAINAGSPVNAPTTDFFGNAIIGNPDMGAIEYYPTYAYIEYGTDTNYGQQTTHTLMTNFGNFTATLSSLTSGTTYHYRAVASMGVAKWYGSDLTFRTPLVEDVNQDGSVNILDLIKVAQDLGSNLSNSDINGDGSVDILDIILCAQKFN